MDIHDISYARLKNIIKEMAAEELIEVESWQIYIIGRTLANSIFFKIGDKLVGTLSLTNTEALLELSLVNELHQEIETRQSKRWLKLRGLYSDE